MVVFNVKLLNVLDIFQRSKENYRDHKECMRFSCT